MVDTKYDKEFFKDSLNIVLLQVYIKQYFIPERIYLTSTGTQTVQQAKMKNTEKRFMILLTFMNGVRDTYVIIKASKIYS